MVANDFATPTTPVIGAAIDAADVVLVVAQHRIIVVPGEEGLAVRIDGGDIPTGRAGGLMPLTECC